LVRSFGFPRPIIKLHPEEKLAVALARGAPQNLGFSFNISATTEGIDFKIVLVTTIASGWWGLPRPIITSHPEEKEGVALG